MPRSRHCLQWIHLIIFSEQQFELSHSILKIQSAFLHHCRHCTQAACICRSYWEADSWCADVYERMTPNKGRPPFYAVYLTQSVSGVWHGLFPGYGLFFVSSAFAIEASKVLYRYERAYGGSKRKGPTTLAARLWAVVKWFYTAFTLNYLCGCLHG